MNKPYTYISYRAYKAYACFMLRRLLYRRTWVDGSENIPLNGERTLIISNHQNSASDALALVEAMPNSLHPFVVARGDVFWVHPLVTKFFLWIGMLPAFRLDFEGGDALEKNEKSFQLISKYINLGYPVAVFPSAGHMRGHYLGDFTTGYLKMAFRAAEETNWEEDIRILPSCNHYTSYEGIQGDVLVRFGQPVSLRPYYQEYREHPYPTLRKLNKMFKEQVRELMLDLDEEHLWALDWIRTSEIGEMEANHEANLIRHLDADRRYMAEVAKKAEQDPEIYTLAQALSDWRERNKIEDTLVHPEKPAWSDVIAGMLGLLILLPVWIACLWPHALNYWLPAKLRKGKTADFTWTNSYRLILSVVALLPLEALVTLLVLGLGFGWWWQAAAYILMWTTLGRWAGQYWNFARRTFRQLWVLRHPKEMAEYENLRRQLNEKLTSVKD